MANTEPSFWPRLTAYDGRAVEHALAPPTLFSPGLRLAGAVAEAPFVNSSPPLLELLLEVQSPFVVDPVSLRFTSEAFRDIKAVAGLPYAPTASPHAR